MLDVNVSGLAEADTALRKFAAQLSDFRPFWRILGEHLATEAQRRWPLRRQSGWLRESLVWQGGKQGGKIGRRGVFEASPDRLAFGTSLFYGRFSQSGTKRQRKRALIHIDRGAQHELLEEWAADRARAAGLEVKK